VTPLEGLRAAAPEIQVQHADGANLETAAALAAASEAAVVVVGLDWRHEGEHIHNGDLAPILRQMPPPEPLLRRFGRARLAPLWAPLAGAIATMASLGSALPGGDFASGDRTDLRLPPEQETLIRSVAAANPRTIVVLMGGGAILCEAWRHVVPAILLLWYPGMEGGAALADVLLGRVSPSGRMPFAVPTAHEHLPPFDPRARKITYDLWHGYRRLRRQGHPAAFPFGFGLSYGAFAYSLLTAEIVGGCGEGGVLRVAVTVENVGTMAAADVVQLYGEMPARAVERPARFLVAFTRVSLAPGQVERVSLDVPLRRLALFDEAADAFVLEGGRHRVVVARHAEDDGIGVEVDLEAAVVGR
jgi:beta-glucosidase